MTRQEKTRKRNSHEFLNMNTFQDLILCMGTLCIAPYLAKTSKTAVLSTYNLWNTMFNWDIRKLRISQMLRESGTSIAAFQEVRSHFHTDYSQITDLHQLLPEFPWLIYESANTIQKIQASYHDGWQLEGIGVLSKYPVKRTRRHYLTSHHGPDTNKRLVLEVELEFDVKTTISLFVVHFSYDRRQQCQNAAETLKIVHALGSINTIVLGDFNTYSDFDDPVHLLVTSRDLSANMCQLSAPLSSITSLQLRDAWESTTAMDGHTGGLTFSNMPTPGYESRPDRILVSQAIQVHSVSLPGDGTRYKDSFYIHIIWHRFVSVLSSAHNSHQGVHGYSCLHDCGPRGSCRCGVCVSGDNEHTCHLPNCDECNRTTYLFVIVFLILFVVSISQLIYGIVLTLLTSVRGHGRKDNFGLTLIGSNCCLLNNDLYSNSPATTSLGRVSRHRRFWRTLYKIWPPLRLSPAILVLFSIGMHFLLIIFGRKFFHNLLSTVSAVMDEEYYPSDHLMVCATINIKT